MIRLRAKVKIQEDSADNHPIADYEESNHIPNPDWIEIEEGQRGFLLIHVYLREGPFVHTWHDSIQSAKQEAKTDFAVEESDWEDIA
jgi:hypothetical protein